MMKALDGLADGIHRLARKFQRDLTPSDQCFDAAVIREIAALRAALAERILRDTVNRAALTDIASALLQVMTIMTSHNESARISAAATMHSAKRARRAGMDLSAIARQIILALGISAQVLVPVAAMAQPASTPTDAAIPVNLGMTPDDYGVMERGRPDFDAKGIPLGGFRLLPSMSVNGSFDDNVYRQATATSDWYFEQTPQARIQSEWGRHFVEIYAGLDNYNYARNTRLNLTDWTGGAGGRYDIAHNAYFRVGGNYGKMHESLSSPNTVGFQLSPNRYNLGHAEVQTVYQPSRIRFDLYGSLDSYSWRDTPVIGGGVLSNSDRNSDEYKVSLKTSYQFSPGYEVFIKGLYDSRDFGDLPDRSGAYRSSHGYRFDAGVNLQLTHLLSGEIYVGYLDQMYRKGVPAPLPDVSGLDYSATLNWYVSPLLTMHLEGARTLSDVTITGVSAADNKNIRLSADYEFLRNVIVQGYFSYTDVKFTGTARKDSYPSAGVSVRYLMNHNVSADLKFDHDMRDSSAPGADFDSNVVMLGLNLHI